MKKSLLLLASFAGLVACWDKEGGKPAEDGQSATDTCPAETAAAEAAPEKKAEEPAAAPAATEAPADKTAQ